MRPSKNYLVDAGSTIEGTSGYPKGWPVLLSPSGIHAGTGPADGTGAGHRDHDTRFFKSLGWVMADRNQRKQRLDTALL